MVERDKLRVTQTAESRGEEANEPEESEPENSFWSRFTLLYLKKNILRLQSSLVRFDECFQQLFSIRKLS